MTYKAVFTSKFLDDTKRLKGELKQRLEKSVRKIIENPYLGKPLRYVLKGTRRVHIGPFVLIYEIIEKEKKVIFLKFAHHDEAYR
jgi:addiction module RelE/StbE family toxin